MPASQRGLMGGYSQVFRSDRVCSELFGNAPAPFPLPRPNCSYYKLQKVRVKSKLGCGKDILVVMVWPEHGLDPRLDVMTPRSPPKGSRATAAGQATCRDGDSQNPTLVVKAGESAAPLKVYPSFCHK